MEKQGNQVLNHRQYNDLASTLHCDTVWHLGDRGQYMRKNVLYSFVDQIRGEGSGVLMQISGNVFLTVFLIPVRMWQSACKGLLA